MKPCPPCYLTAVAPGAAAGLLGCAVEVDLRQGADGVKALVVQAMGGACMVLGCLSDGVKLRGR